MLLVCKTTYKQRLKSYQGACKTLGVEPNEAIMVAAHGWDCAGIKADGLQSVFASRPSKAMCPLGNPPDLVVKYLNELVKELIGLTLKHEVATN